MFEIRHFPLLSQTPLALTIGNFDGIHLGHQKMLEVLCEGAAERKLLPAVLTFEPHPREVLYPEKKPVRLITFAQKMRLLQEKGVGRVYVARFTKELAMLSPEAFAHVLFKQLQAKFIVAGNDYRFGHDRLGDCDFLAAIGQTFDAEVFCLFAIAVNGQRVSSSALREALKEGDFVLARQMLGRDYSLYGKVVKGDGLGRAIGFPTANVHLKHKNFPLTGVFAVNTKIGKQMVRGVANFGVRPTLNKPPKSILEVHLFEWQQEIYGERIEVFFLKKIRNEIKFPNLEALKQQIAADRAVAKHFFEKEYHG